MDEESKIKKMINDCRVNLAEAVSILNFVVMQSDTKISKHNKELIKKVINLLK